MPKNKYETRKGRVPSVTTIIENNLGWNKRVLGWWNWSQGAQGYEYMETANQAADIGTLAHMGVEADVKGEQFDVATIKNISEEDRVKVARCLASYRRWKEMHSMRMVHSELKLVSELYQYGGQLDIAGITLGDVERRSIIDYKTSNNVYPEHIIQIAAYGGLWNENYPDQQIEEYHLIRTGKENAGFEHRYWPASEMVGVFAVFLMLRQLHNAKKMIRNM